MCTQLAWMHATSEHTMSTTCTHALRSRYPCAERRRGGQKGGQKGGRKGTRRTRPKAQSISTPAMWANMGMAASSAKAKPVRKSSLKKVPLPQQLARQVCRPRTTRAGVPCRCLPTTPFAPCLHLRWASHLPRPLVGEHQEQQAQEEE